MLLLDELIAEPEFREHHSIEVAAPQARAYDAARRLTGLEARVLGPAATLRALPTVARHPRTLGPQVVRAALGARSKPVIDQLLDAGFVLLAERPGREIVVGVVGRLWTLTDTAPVALDGRDAFLGFSEPGNAKAALNLAVGPAAGGSLVVTETRAVTTSPDAHRAFDRYWRATLAPAAAIRRSWLRAIRRRAEG